MKIENVIFYSATALLTVIMCFSVYNYFVNHEMIQTYFDTYNYPTYLVYPLAIAKLLGLVAIWGNFSNWLKEWAYAGFFFDIVLAITAHFVAKDGGQVFAIVALIAVLVSYFLGKKVRP